MKMRIGRLPGCVTFLWIGLGCAPPPVDEPVEKEPVYDLEPAPPAGRPMELEDYYRIISLRSPRLSPDGEWVVYVASTPVEQDNTSRESTWLVPADASAEAVEVRVRGQSVSNPRWNDDGQLLVTAADRAWSVHPRMPGRGRPVEAAPEGLAGPAGSWRAILRDSPLEEPPPAALTDFERRHQERFEGLDFDWMNFQRDGRPFPVPDPRRLPARHIVLSGDDGSEKVLLERDLRPSTLRWAPSGEALAFIADSHFRDEHSYGRSDVWVVDLEGELRRLTDDGHTYSGLEFSPDGRFLATVRGFGTDMVIEQRLDHGGPRDLVLLPVEGGQTRNLTAQWDLMAGSPTFSADGAHIYFSAQQGGTTHLYRASVDGAGVEQVTHGQRRLQSIDFDAEQRRITYVSNTMEAPGEIFVRDLESSQEVQLTRAHEAFLAEVSPSRTQRLQFASEDGTPIEGWLYYPYGFGPEKGPYPLIVHSHGGPHSATGYGFSFKHHYFAANGYFVLTTNFRGSTGYGEAFKWAIWGAWGDLDGQDVMAGVDHVIDHFPIDPARVGATGHSYGGFMSNWLIVQYPDRFAAAVVGAGISNWLSDYGTADVARTKETEFFGTPWQEDSRRRLLRQSPLIYADRAKAATLFVHGELDHRVPFEEAEQMYFALKKNGVEARMVVYKGQAHGIRGHWNAVHRALTERLWWDRYLAERADEESTTTVSRND